MGTNREESSVDVANDPDKHCITCYLRYDFTWWSWSRKEAVVLAHLIKSSFGRSGRSICAAVITNEV